MKSVTRRAATLLENAVERTTATQALVGLDGFVDSIIRVVERKQADGERLYYPDIPAFARRVANAAGKSTALELSIQLVKLGGNGPIMANALSQFGLPVTYVGAIGQGDGIHPVFQPMGERCRLIPVGDAASTDALEFNDGKLMFQKMECLDRLDYDAIVAAMGVDGIVERFEACTAVALNHWASLPHMSAIWQRLIDEVCPRLSQRPRYLFFDLADTEKRDPADIRQALDLIGRFRQWYDTNLGLNEKESEHIAEVLGLADEPHLERRAAIVQRAAAIRQRLDIGSVVIHPTAFAAAADTAGAIAVDGPYVKEPLISTGAGDHFNAGYFLGRCLEGQLDECLQLGVATSGHYVRTAESPTVATLRQFVLSLD